MKRSVRNVGTWRDEEGGERNAVVEIAVEPGEAVITVGSLDEPQRNQMFTGDRRIAYYLGRVEAAIRAAEYRASAIIPDPKPKDRRRRRQRGH